MMSFNFPSGSDIAKVLIIICVIVLLIGIAIGSML